MAELELNVRAEGAVRGAARAERALDGVKGSALGAEGALDRTTQSSVRLGRAFGIAGAAIAATATAFAARSIPAFRAQNAALAEVSTLIEGTTEQIEAIDTASRNFAGQFGGTATQQVEAFYQAISAGVGDVADATTFLQSANTLAKAGVSDVTTAVDVLSSALNAYKDQGLGAAEASDILFSGVQAGKTNLDQLAATLGNVIPIATEVGVGFDEVVASVAALTKQGQSTAQAVTGVRSALGAILKPTKEASDLAAELGIEFNAAALESQGLAGFLETVAEATGGSKEQLAQLFGSLESLPAVFALTGSAADDLRKILSDIASSAGVTEEAAKKVADSLEDRLAVQLSILGNAGLRVGEALLTVLVPALEVVTSAFINAGPVIEGLAVLLVGLAASQIPAAIGALATLTTTFSLYSAAATVAATATGLLNGAITILGGPIGVLAGLIGAATAAWVIFGRNSETAETASFNAAAAISKVNGELDVFWQATAPNSAIRALELAQANQKLAQSAVDAAAAELQKQKALLAFAEGAGLGGQSSIRDTGVSASIEAQRTAEALNRLIAAESDLQRVRENLSSTQDAIVGAGLSSDVDFTLPVAREITETADAATDLAGAFGSVKDILGDLPDTFSAGSDGADRLADAFAQTATSIVLDAENASNAIRNLINNLASAFLNAGFSGLFGGLTSGLPSAIASVFSAQGNAFAGGNVIPFATGGVVSSPTFFPMTGSQTGVMGEAGPEAILPLERTASGDLGVKAAGAGGVNITVNVDARGAQQGVGSDIVARLRPVLRDEAVAAVKDAQRRAR